MGFQLIRDLLKPKCHFFAWTLLHKKILTANNLIKRNWPNDPTCKLCSAKPETPTHLCKDCIFSKQVWALIKIWFGLSVIDVLGENGSLHSYWRRCRMKIDKPRKRRIDDIMIYFWWNIWKVRNIRTFQNKNLQPSAVALLCKEEIDQFNLATRVEVLVQ